MKQLEKEINARDRKEASKPWTVALLALAVIALIGGGIYWAATREGSEEITAESETTTEPTQEEKTDAEPLKRERAQALPPTVECSYREDGQGEYYKGLPEMKNVSTQGTVDITLDTTAGPIPLTLDRAVSPCTVNAIEYLAEQKYYDDTVCHRLTTSGIHVLQCGDPSGTGAGGPGFQFNNEFPTDEVDKNDIEAMNTPLNYERGTIAMANAGEDEKGNGTNGSQFFLNYSDSPLPPMYTYFGTINEEGLATLDEISKKGIKEGSESMGPGDGAPKDEVKIKSVSVTKI
nr:peptidylprolyl isomerase [Corynebacterium aquatimens]